MEYIQPLLRFCPAFALTSFSFPDFVVGVVDVGGFSSARWHRDTNSTIMRWMSFMVASIDVSLSSTLLCLCIHHIYVTRKKNQLQQQHQQCFPSWTNITVHKTVVQRQNNNNNHNKNNKSNNTTNNSTSLQQHYHEQ